MNLKHWIACFGDWLSTRQNLRAKPDATNDEISRHHQALRDYAILHTHLSGICSRGPFVFECLCVMYGRQRTQEYWDWIGEMDDDEYSQYLSRIDAEVAHWVREPLPAPDQQEPTP